MEDLMSHDISAIRRSAFSVLLALLFASCTPAKAPVETQMHPTATIPATQTSPPSNIPTKTPAQLPPSPTPNQAAIHFLPTTFEQPGAWTLRHPYSNLQAPILFNLYPEGYSLIPDFQVASIDFLYRWVGIGDSVREYQRIERKGDSFWRDGTVIAAEAVESLVQSINHLKIEPHTLSVTTHTDDYPFWTVELTSLSGDKVLLSSNSNSSSFIPWNVIYYGDIYAQFDGGIPNALSGLFEVVEGQTIASFYGPQEEGYLQTTTLEPPPAQVIEGFNGLFPLGRAFAYNTDSQQGKISGYLSDKSYTDTVGETEINWLRDFQAAELLVDAQPVACELENIPQEEPEWVYWRFTCPVGQPGNDGTYQLPINMTFSTSTGEPYTLTGELFGYWEAFNILPLIPYPDEIGEVLKNSAILGDLLKDHLMYVVRSYSLADASSGLMTHHWDANVLLIGQAQVGERVIPYTVFVDHITVEDGKLDQWYLDRSELKTLLEAVLGQPITQHFLESDPDGVINLYYGESNEYPLIEPDDLQACAYLPQGKTLPATGQPLRGFSFNLPLEYFGSGFYSMQIVFMDNTTRVYELNLRPYSAADAFWMSLMPAAFKPSEAPSFARIDAMSRGPAINVMWSSDASPAEVSYYNAMFTGWEAKPLIYDPGIKLQGRWFDLTPEGELVLLDCQVP
jgi:hypothetical protein